MKAKVELDQFLTDLRSGEYEQCRKILHKADDGYCCLGVWTDRLGKITESEPWQHRVHSSAMWSAVVESATGIESEEGVREFALTVGINPKQAGWRAITEELLSLLMRMNDRGDTFEVIAEWLETARLEWIMHRFWDKGYKNSVLLDGAVYDPGARR